MMKIKINYFENKLIIILFLSVFLLDQRDIMINKLNHCKKY